MKKQKIFWFIFLTSAIISSFGIVGVVWYSIENTREMHEQRVAEYLHNEAELLFLGAKDRMTHEYLNDFLAELSQKIGSRVTIIQEDGVVLAESDRRNNLLENHLQRPEVQDALKKGLGQSIRWSHTVEQELIYVAISRVLPSGSKIVIRAAFPVLTVDQAVMQNAIGMTKMAMIFLIVSFLMSWFVSRYIGKKLHKVETWARYMSEGDTQRKIPDMPWLEFHNLGQSINHLADQLDERVQNALRQRNEREAILSSMVEGVLALNKKHEVIRMNQVCRDLLGLEGQHQKGRSFHELVHHKEMLRLISKIKKNSATFVQDLDFKDAVTPKIIELRGTPILDENGKLQGVLCVLNDVTRIRQLEMMRQDFVANVSHELRTPITSIMGFTEAIQDAPWEKPATVTRFLDIIQRQSHRMQAIIEDMLELSRLEKVGTLAKVHQNIAPLIESASEVCKLKAENKEITINVECEHGIKGLVNANLFEQIVVNLLSNAIKYSSEGTIVHILCEQKESGFMFKIVDQGWGIPSQSLDRIFERFYRVDKARSRDVGGTGLGLAIVKHIVVAHQGQIQVDSEVGVGTTFVLDFPG